jgi:hypothetical protein
VVQALQERIGFGLENFKVDTKTGLIEFYGRCGNLHLPVMPMQVLAITLVMDKTMGCGKRCAYHKSVHINIPLIPEEVFTPDGLFILLKNLTERLHTGNDLFSPCKLMHLPGQMAASFR